MNTPNEGEGVARAFMGIVVVVAFIIGLIRGVFRRS